MRKNYMNLNMQNHRGFTLVEMLVVMVIFMGLLLIMSYTFEHIVKTGGQQVKSAETSTEGIVGLEMLRVDLEHAGFGLPWTIPSPPAAGWYNEATASPVNGVISSDYNETIPSALRVGFTPAGNKILDHSGNTNPRAAYLVIKSTRVALDPAAQNWSYVTYAYNPSTSNNVSTIKSWNRPSDDFAAGDLVITLNNTFDSNGTPGKQLAMVDATHYYYSIPGGPPVAPPNDVYKPSDESQYIVVYGVIGAINGSTLRMPYNRADYYIRAPSAGETAKLPTTCNPGTGVLFKGEVQQATGTFTEYPLLNCAADLQVEFELDLNNNGNISYSSTLPGTAADVRSQLKAAHVYILAHEGKKDGNYSYPNDSIQVGDAARPSSSGKVLDAAAMAATFGADWRNYRWKVYTIVVNPKNLL